MTQANTLVASATVIALTLGIGGQTPTPVQQEQPLSTDDILVVTNEAAPQAGQTDESAEDSAKMGKQEGTQGGESQGDVPKSKTDEASPY
jgi:hypothetical protein